MVIKNIHVKAFKSMFDTSFEPGNINVLIGANGSGKSTVLEAVGILSAALTDRVDDNSLRRKGIRLSAPQMYKSKFRSIDRAPTYVEFGVEWSDGGDSYSYTADLTTPTDDDSWKYLAESVLKNGDSIWGRSNRSKDPIPNNVGYFMTNEKLQGDQCRAIGRYIEDYGIYQPDTFTLRGNVPDQTATSPLGLAGGRLADAVQDIMTEDENGDIRFGNLDIDDILELIDWASGFRVSSPKKTTLNSGVSSTRQVIEFEDKYLKNKSLFTGYDASEGALYVLFMLTLAMHPDAPKMFAIDNFDHALNPRLVRKLTTLFCDQIIDQNKTVFLTTHNPLVLDGLDLQDDRIRLFTVDRTAKGYVKLNRIQVSQELIENGVTNLVGHFVGMAFRY